MKKIDINYTTVYKIAFALIISLSAYMGILSKSKIANICIIVGISVLLAVCGAIVEIVISDSFELKSIITMFGDLFSVRSCTIDTSPKAYDLDMVDFTFDGCDKEKTREVFEILSEIVSNVYVIGCGRFNYCQFYVDSSVSMYAKILYVSMTANFDIDLVVDVPSYEKYDITNWIYNIMLYKCNGYRVGIKYNENTDTHFACVVDKN